MNTQAQTHVKASPMPGPAARVVPTELGQQKCACGVTAGVDGMCIECRQQSLSVRRRTASPASPLPAVPPIVNEVLRSPGQPLDASTRTFMEPRFGHDFSNVRVHTDARAIESARAVNALAYTVGSNIVFGAGQYTADTDAGKKLIAHELTHVVQQQHASSSHSLQPENGPSHDPLECEASQVAQHILQPMKAKTAIAPLSPSPLGLYRQAAEGRSTVQAQAQPQPSPAPPQLTAEQKALTDQLRREAKDDGVKVKKLLQDLNWLGQLDTDNQDAILAIAEKWANKPPTGIRLTPFDYFLVGLHGTIFQIGSWVEQYTSSYDRLFHIMDEDHIDRFKTLTQLHANVFKDDKALDEVHFEVTKENVVEGLEMARDVAVATAELAAAAATGGASEIALLGIWLVDTLPGLYRNAKALIGFVDTIRGIKVDDVKAFFSAQGIGELLVKALFGELQGLATITAEEEKGEQGAEKEPADGRGEKGLIRLFYIITRVLKALKSAYGKFASFINTGLGAINITNQKWFEPFSIAYATIVQMMQLASDPGAVLGEAAAKMREMVEGFFKGIRTKVGEVTQRIQSGINDLTDPAHLVQRLSDKIVEWILNFIITNPPSQLFKLIARIAQKIAGKPLIDILRENVSFADKIIKKIAESDTVKNIMQPLAGPVSKVTEAVAAVSGKVDSVISNVEGRAIGLMGSGMQMVKDLAGLNVSQPTAEASTGSTPTKQAGAGAQGPSSSGDFLSTIKHGIHTRLLAWGIRNGAQKVKAVVKRGVEAVKGIVLGKEIDFDVRNEHHQLWAEEQDGRVRVFVASKKTAIVEKLASYKTSFEIASRNPSLDKGQRSLAEKHMKELEALNIQAESVSPRNLKVLDSIERKMVPIVKQLDLVMLSDTEQTFSELGQELKTHGRDIEQQVAKKLKQLAPDRYRKFVEQLRDEAAQLVIHDKQFMQYWRAGNMQSAGSRFHLAAQEVGMEVYSTHKNWDFDVAVPFFELRIQGGKSRLDVLIVQLKPKFMLYEFDYKTHTRSALGSVEEMEQHRDHILKEFTNVTEQDLIQESVSWKVAVRRALNKEKFNRSKVLKK